MAGVTVRHSLSFTETTTLPPIINEFSEELRQIAILGSLEAFSGYENDGTAKDWQSFCQSLPTETDIIYCTDVFTRSYENGEAPWMERNDIR